MLDILHREQVYLWYYFQLQLSQIFRYWVLGMVLGIALSALFQRYVPAEVVAQACPWRTRALGC